LSCWKIKNKTEAKRLFCELRHWQLYTIIMHNYESFFAMKRGWQQRYKRFNFPSALHLPSHLVTHSKSLNCKEALFMNEWINNLPLYLIKAFYPSSLPFRSFYYSFLLPPLHTIIDAYIQLIKGFDVSQSGIWKADYESETENSCRFSHLDCCLFDIHSIEASLSGYFNVAKYCDEYAKILRAEIRKPRFYFDSTLRVFI
jgi:hypothetical protein